MAQQANVTLNSVVYPPAGTFSGVSSWINRSGGYGTSFSTLKEQVVSPVKGDVVRIKFDLDLPVVATTDTDCSCAGTQLRKSTVQLSVWIPSSSTAAERLDLYTRLVDLMASTPVQNAVKNLEPSYG